MAGWWPTWSARAAVLAVASGCAHGAGPTHATAVADVSGTPAADVLAAGAVDSNRTVDSDGTEGSDGTVDFDGSVDADGTDAAEVGDSSSDAVAALTDATSPTDAQPDSNSDGAGDADASDTTDVPDTSDATPLPDPTTEVCNGLDDDQDGSTDEGPLCDDGNSCTTDTCLGTAGCSAKKSTGTPCDDGEPCSAKDECIAGTCTAGFNLCQCLGDVGCGTFDDGNLCNGTLHCDKSLFPYQCKQVPGSVVTCSQQYVPPCWKAQCVPSSGKCALKMDDGQWGCEAQGPCQIKTACAQGHCQGVSGCECPGICGALQDGDVCNGIVACKASYLGSCAPVAETIVVCDGSQNTTCAQAVCDPITGGCSLKPTFEGGPCEDGDPCTQGTTCQAGTCVGGTQVCGCTKDSDCGKADPCAGSFVCESGTCEPVPGTAVVCDPAQDTACTKSTCDAANGKCYPRALVDGVACEDGNPCTIKDVCQAGLCKSGANACECATDQDCAKFNVYGLCAAKFTCDKSQAPYKCKQDPKTAVVCPTDQDTPCRKNTCHWGKCGLEMRLDGTPCDGGTCAFGTCVAP